MYSVSKTQESQLANKEIDNVYATQKHTYTIKSFLLESRERDVCYKIATRNIKSCNLSFVPFPRN